MAAPSRMTLFLGKLWIVSFAIGLFHTSDIALARNPGNCQVSIKDIAPEENLSNRSILHVAFNIVDENFDKTGNSLRQVFVEFGGNALVQGFTSSMNTVLIGRTSLALSPGDQVESGVGEIQAFGGTRILRVDHVYGKITGCYIQ